MKVIVESGGIIPINFNFHVRWRRMVNLSSQPLYIWGKSPR
jgi:hypothetical protein